MMKKSIGILMVFAFLFGSGLFAQNVNNAPRVDNDTPTITLVPSPGEVLNSLSKIGGVKWGDYVTYNKTFNYKGRYNQALNLGVRAADAFAALQDKDKVNFGEMNRTIFALAKELGISNVMEQQSQRLSTLSQGDDWTLLIIEMNDMNGQIIDELVAQNDEDILLLTNVGGFVEGVRIISGYLADNYDVQNTNLLKKQASLMAYFIGEIDKNQILKKDKKVMSLYKGLVKMQGLLKQNNTLSLKIVQQIQSVSVDVISSVTK